MGGDYARKQKVVAIITVTIIFAIVSSITGLSQQTPGESHQFEGNVTINGQPVGTMRDNFFVEARINGSLVADEYVRGSVYGRPPAANYTIPDPNNTLSGKTVEFSVDDIKAADAVFQNGGYTFLNLSVNGDLQKCGDNICSGYDSCTRCPHDCGSCVGNEIEVTLITPKNNTTINSNKTPMNITTNENAVCEFTLRHCSITPRTADVGNSTLIEGESGLYHVVNIYNITAVFVGTTTARFKVNDEITPSIQEGESYMLNDGAVIKVWDVFTQEYAGGIRKVTFYLSLNITGCGNDTEKALMATTGNQSHLHPLDWLGNTKEGEWKRLIVECVGESLNAKNVTADFYVDSVQPAVNITSPASNSNLTANSVWLNVSSDENVICTYSLIGCTLFDTWGSCGGTAPQNMSTTGTTSHSQFVTGLSDTASNQYNMLSVECADIASNSNRSSVKFHVDTQAPAIHKVRSVFVTNSSVRIKWAVSEPSNGTLEFGLNTSYGYTAVDQFYTYVHEFDLTGLQQGTAYHYKIRSSDYFGNENVSSDYIFTTSTSENFKRTIPANETTTINFSVVNVTLGVLAEGAVGDAEINISASKDSPTNVSLNVNQLKYIDVKTTAELSFALISVVLKIHYIDSELSEANISESTLTMYWFNESLSNWIRLNTSLGWINSTGVDTENNYVWANVSHFSSYGVGGLTANGYTCSSNSQCTSNYCSNNICSNPPSDNSNTPSNNGGGSGGGSSGGGGLPKAKKNETKNVTQTPMTRNIAEEPKNSPVEAAHKPEPTAILNLTQAASKAKKPGFGGITGFVTALPEIMRSPAVAAIIALTFLAGIYIGRNIRKSRSNTVKMLIRPKHLK